MGSWHRAEVWLAVQGRVIALRRLGSRRSRDGHSLGYWQYREVIGQPFCQFLLTDAQADGHRKDGLPRHWSDDEGP
ncbi:hypothetical protein MTO96_042726 [Rhipicephalus appendiculatus]